MSRLGGRCSSCQKYRTKLGKDGVCMTCQRERRNQSILAELGHREQALAEAQRFTYDAIGARHGVTGNTVYNIARDHGFLDSEDDDEP